MKILILEDSIERIELFKQLFKNQEVFIFNNSLDAHHACMCNEFSIMFLDHDLDNKIWVDSQEENTGYQFVKWLVNNKLQQNALIYIHSMNPCGANNMLNYLVNNGYDGIWIPYRLLKLEETNG
jgi:hypothetical protein